MSPAAFVRGRRRVGKSRLVEEFVDRADVPHVFFAASGRPVRDELRLFGQEVAASNLPGAELFSGIELAGWDAALRLLATALPGELHAHRTRLPGAAVDTPLIAVARSGCSVDGVEHFGPDELIAHD